MQPKIIINSGGQNMYFTKETKTVEKNQGFEKILNKKLNFR